MHLVGDVLAAWTTFARTLTSTFFGPAERFQGVRNTSRYVVLEQEIPESAVYVAHLGLGLGLLEEGAVGARDVHLSSSLNSHTHWSRLLSPCNWINYDQSKLCEF